MSKQNLIGIALIGILLFAYSFFFNKPSKQEVSQNAATTETKQEGPTDFAGTSDPVKLTETVDSTYLFSLIKPTNKLYILENENLSVSFSDLGAMPVSSILKKHKSYTGAPLTLFQKGDFFLNLPLRTNQQRILNTQELTFQVISASSEQIIFRLPFSDQEFLDLTYSLPQGGYMISLDIDWSHLSSVLASNIREQDFEWSLHMPKQEQSWKFENQYANIYYKYPGSDVEKLSATKKEQDKNIREALKWVGFSDKYFSTVLISGKNNRLENNKFAFTTATENSDYLKEFVHSGSFSVDLQNKEKVDLQFFMGPLQYKMLKDLDKPFTDNEKLDLKQMVYLGASVFRWINVGLIMPIVDFLKGFVSNWGLIILLLTLVIKTLLWPLTFKSYMSQAKMRVLKPQIDAINARYPGTDQKMMMKRSQETMSLYKSAGVSPMSGCLPMLLQMPFLIALYMYFPTAIDLRGEGFLWAKDLSTYDGIIHWSVNIPIISGLIGNHISLFCLLWCITNVFYTRYTMNMSGGGMDNPQMKPMRMMPYIMTIMFFFFFNSQAAGLTYYYLISTLITMLQFFLSRVLINEEKVLKRLEENKKKPHKKSGFMARLEEMQKERERQLREQRNQRR